MTNILKFKYTPFVIALLTFFWYLPNVTPGYTWISAGVDAFDFIFAAKYHLVPHATGFPAYMIPANLILMLFPNVHIAWILALTLSTIPSIITGLLVFYSIKKLVEDWGYDDYPKQHHTLKELQHFIELRKLALWAPYVGLFITYGAVILISQTFIVEVYTFSAMIGMFAITFHIRKQHKLAALFLGLAFAAHGLIWTMMFFLFIIHWRIYIKKLWIIIPAALIPYIYLPIGLHFTEIREANVLVENSVSAYIEFFLFGSSTFWWGSLPIWNIHERLWDTITIMSVSLGLGSLSLILFFKHDLKKYWWLLFVIGPTLYYWLGTAVNIVYVHLALAVPVLIILAALGIKHSKIHPKWYIITSLITIASIPFFWNLGINLDKNQAAQTYYNFLSTFDTDDHIIVNIALTNSETTNTKVLTDGVAVWWAVLLYNRLNDRELIPVSPNKFLIQNESADPEQNDKRQILSMKYQESYKDLGLNPIDSLILRDKTGTGWHVNINGVRTSIPNNGYDTCSLNCLDPNRNIFQTQLWWFIDRLFLANPNKIIHITENIGKEDKDIVDRIYTRELLPNNIREIIDSIYMEIYGNSNPLVISGSSNRN